MIKACKKCRREGDKLMLKGERCFSAKCALTRRPYIPGQHGPSSRTKLSEYGRQLREKQKIKRIYGLSESDLERVYREAERIQGNTAENIIKLIESRVDNVVYRTGVCQSRSDSRQVVSHGHVLLDGKKMSTASAQVNPGQSISFDKTVKVETKKIKPASWIKQNEKTKTFEYTTRPSREEIDLNINENLVVEYYSR